MGSHAEHADRREALVVSALDLVADEERNYRTWRIQRADLRQAGMVGLLIAADRYEPHRGVPFRAFARYWVRKEMQRALGEGEFAAGIPPSLTGPLVALRGLADPDTTNLQMAAAALGVSPATVTALHRQLAVATSSDEILHQNEDSYALPDPNFPDPEQAGMARAMITVLRQAWATLDPPTARALALRYGLDGEGERSLRQVAHILGCSDHTVKARIEAGHKHLRTAIG
jgi:RNA polymerase sigma factor (sigma-70 family)